MFRRTPRSTERHQPSIRRRDGVVVHPTRIPVSRPYAAALAVGWKPVA
ncbi:MAG: hypothetical protein U0R80_00670 [Nocardioidaceae bacterium]